MMRLLIAGLLAAAITAQVGMLLFDAGYWSADDATAVAPVDICASGMPERRLRAGRRHRNLQIAGIATQALVNDLADHWLDRREQTSRLADRWHGPQRPSRKAWTTGTEMPLCRLGAARMARFRWSVDSRVLPQM